MNIEIYNGGYTDEQRKLDQAEHKERAKAETERAKQKQAVLDKLGITAVEAALLLN